MPTLAELGMQNFGGAMSESQRMQLKLFNEERTQVRVVKRDNRPVALNGLGCVRGDDVDGEHVVEGIVTASQLKELHDQVLSDRNDAIAGRRNLHAKVEMAGEKTSQAMNELRRELKKDIEEVRKELSEKTDGIPERVITMLKNTGAI